MTNTTTGLSEPRLRLGSPADVLAAVPYLLGFHPHDSLVVVGLGGRRLRVRCTSRADLPPAGDERATEQFAAHVAGLAAAQPVHSAILVAYGSTERAQGTLELTRAALEGHAIGVREVLRAHAGRYWSYGCAHTACRPPEGTPYDVGSSTVAAQATFAGCVALPDREALRRSIAPSGGTTRVSMRQATSRARQRMEAWTADCADASVLRHRVVGDGSDRVRAALGGCRGGEAELSDDEVAWLSLLLAHIPVRDEAWSLIEPRSLETHRVLWTRVVRGAEEPYVPAPACLLAFTAWQQGDGAFAWVAVDRAREADHDYSMALLLSEALARGLPPSSWHTAQ